MVKKKAVKSGGAGYGKFRLQLGIGSYFRSNLKEKNRATGIEGPRVAGCQSFQGSHCD